MFDNWIDLWNGNLSLAPATLSPDLVVHAAPIGGGPELRGPDALTGWIAQLRSAFTELTFAVEVGPITEGPLTAARWTATGVYGSGFPGATAAPGTPIFFTGTDTLRAAPDGRYAEYWLNSDLHVLLAQLGAR